MRRWALPPALFALALGGCSVVVAGGDDDPVRCALPDASNGTDPCTALGMGFRCIGGICTQRECLASEVCNADDDDCDGRIDEGLDNDNDQLTWCTSGAAGPVDCVDTNAQIHPADPARGIPETPETCDGADNDCDSMVDEAPDGEERLCPLGQGCYPDRGGCDYTDCRLPEFNCPPRYKCDSTRLPAACVLVNEDCTIDGCPPTLRCDPLSLTCVPPRAVGERCDRDAQCDSNLCTPIAALGLRSADTGGGTSVCTVACCSDDDCPAESVCWASGSGARGCVPRAVLARGANGAPLGRACTNAGQCTSEQSCAIFGENAYVYGDRVVLACGAPYRDSDRSPCGSISDCRTGMCITYFCVPFFGCAAYCTSACRQSADCRSGEGCRYLDLTSSGGAPNWLQMCVPTDRTGTAECSRDSDCRDDACIGGRCRATCCSDAQCGSDERCQPLSLHGRWEMHCVPRPVAN